MALLFLMWMERRDLDIEQDIRPDCTLMLLVLGEILLVHADH